jgi:hypothetical protein
VGFFWIVQRGALAVLAGRAGRVRESEPFISRLTMRNCCERGGWLECYKNNSFLRLSIKR